MNWILRGKSSSHVRLGGFLVRKARFCSKPVMLISAVHFFASEDGEEGPKLPKDPLQIPKLDLSHANLIRQSCSMSSEAASTLLTHLVEAYTDGIQTYGVLATELIEIYEDSVIALTEDGGMRVSELKALISDQKKVMSDMKLLYQFVKKLMDSNAEVCFLAGAEFSSVQASERLISAEKTIEQLEVKFQFFELELARAQRSHIDKTGKVWEKINTDNSADNSSKDNKTSED